MSAQSKADSSCHVAGLCLGPEPSSTVYRFALISSLLHLGNGADGRLFIHLLQS